MPKFGIRKIEENGSRIEDRGSKIAKGSLNKSQFRISISPNTMNKAFVKEPDATEGRCPRCNTPGVPVWSETLHAHLSPEAARGLTESAFFCPYANCEVVYFDVFDRVATQAGVKTPVYPKDPAAPICSCFGLTEDDVLADISEGGVTRVKSLIARAKSAEANCATRSPSGQNCVNEVQRCYMRLHGST